MVSVTSNRYVVIGNESFFGIRESYSVNLFTFDMLAFPLSESTFVDANWNCLLQISFGFIFDVAVRDIGAKETTSMCVLFKTHSLKMLHRLLNGHVS